MDGKSPPAQGSNGSPRPDVLPLSPVGTSPKELPITSEEPSEHIDSPLRKKPRLADSGQQIATMSSSPQPSQTQDQGLNGVDHHTEPRVPSSISPPNVHTPSPDETRLLPAQTPSKVTFNLRGSHVDNPIELIEEARRCDGNKVDQARESELADVEMTNQSASASDTPTGSHDRYSTEPEMLNVHAVSPESSSGGGSVVEIQLDGEESFVSPPSLLVNQRPTRSLEDDLMSRFPFSDQWGHTQAVKKIASMAGDGTEVNFEVVEQVDLWLREWFDQFPNYTQRLRNIYLSGHEFWSSFGVLYSKFLCRRSLPNSSLPPDVNHAGKANFLIHFFEQAIRLHSHFMEVSLDDSTSPTDHLPLSMSLRTLKAVDLMFRAPQDVPLLTVFSQRCQIDIFQLQRRLGQFIISRLPNMPERAIEFTNAMMTRDLSSSPKIGLEIERAIRVAGNCYRNIRHAAHRYPLSSAPVEVTAEPATITLTGLVDTAELRLSRELGKEMTLTCDECLSITSTVGDIVHELSCWSVDAANSVFERHYGNLDAPQSPHLPLLNMSTWLVKIFWTFVLKGRMELRIGAVSAITKALLEIHHQVKRQPSDEASRSAVFSPLAQKLVDLRVVEYIVGPESHPQIVSRSRDIMAYMMVTKHWKEHHTDAIWKTIAASSDPRMITATLELLKELANNVPSDALTSFCDKLGQLPLSSLNNPEMCGLIRQLLIIVSLPEKPAELQLNAYKISTLLFSKLEYEGKNAQSVIDYFHRFLAETVDLLASRGMQMEQRTYLYSECLASIRERNSRCRGSIEVLLAILKHNMNSDLETLIEDKDLIESSVEETCAYINEQRSSKPSPSRQSSLISRLKLSFNVLLWRSEHASSHEWERKLWSHVFGAESLDSPSRETAWRQLAAIVDQCQNSNPYIDRCLDVYLHSLTPDRYSPSLFRFVQASLKYIQQTRSQQADNEGQEESFEIPLIDLLWKLFVLAPQNTIDNEAARLLTDQHLDIPLTNNISISLINSAHDRLVTRCIESLKEVSEEFQALSTTSHDSKELDGALPHPRIRFNRILLFLKTFSQQVLARPQLLPSSRGSSEGPMQPFKPVEEDDSSGSSNMVTLKFEAHSQGNGGQRKEVKIADSATFQELYENFRRATGFGDMKFIARGRAFDMTAIMNERIADHLTAGLLTTLIVREVSSAGLPKKPSTSMRPENYPAVTLAVVRNYDVMYDLLDLEDEVATDIYNFLGSFPPSSSLKDTICSCDAPQAESSIFVSGKRLRNLHTVRSMSTLVINQQSNEILDETYISHGIKLLSTTLTDRTVFPVEPKDEVDRCFLKVFLTCLCSFLKAGSALKTTAVTFPDSKAIAELLFGLLCIAKDSHQGSDAQFGLPVHLCLIEASLNSRGVWENFSTKDALDVYLWLLCSNPILSQREAVRDSIISLCQGRASDSLVAPSEFTSFYWRILSQGISRTTERNLEARQFLLTAAAVFPLQGAFPRTETTVHEYFSTWSNLLLQHDHLEHPGKNEVDGVVIGLGRLLMSCLGFLKTFKQSICEEKVAKILFEKYLFPTSTGNKDPIPEINQTCVAVLDAESRKVLYDLVISLCESVTGYSWLTSSIFQITEEDGRMAPASWCTDRSKWFRSPTGYAGLRNLTNTCYMNSLIAQLFMNKEFRGFMLDARTPDGSGAQKLLAETKALFGRMQNGVAKYVDTQSLAGAIRPYDSEFIDVTIQMDVDEFHNLIFDRWEGQILTASEKQKFRSFYGGQLITQIKSMDCDHISERFEPFLTIQCDVKGKMNLSESLDSFVEGDFMEGDNKYKCESCSGRMVDAVKRTCFKDLPDSIVFHLKRFDFDLTTFQRNKINDQFDFPSVINMQKYKVENLSDFSGDNGDLEDLFELVGVLIHNGTAESGHYYSYVRMPSTDDSTPAWIEINDTDVSHIDHQKVFEQSYGGFWEHSTNEYPVPKCYNAYMLFYRRLPSQRTNGHSESMMYETSAEPSIDKSLAKTISMENEICVRRYCLNTSTHTRSCQNILSSFADVREGRCSDSHEIEDKLIGMSLNQLLCVTARLKETQEFDEFAQAIIYFLSNCDRCGSYAIDWIFRRPALFEDVLVLSPLSQVRCRFGRFVLHVLQDLRNSPLYGVDTNESDLPNLEWEFEAGAFTKIVNLMKKGLYTLWKNFRVWDDFFDFVVNIGKLGITEVAILLCEGFLDYTLELLTEDQNLLQHRYNPLAKGKNASQELHKKPPSFSGVAKLTNFLLSHVDPFSHASHIGWYDARDRLQTFDPATRRFSASVIEARAFKYFDQGLTQLVFLGRILEVLEGHEQVNYGEQIVARIFELAPTDDDEGDIYEYSRFISHVGVTIKNIINDYYPNAAGPLLKTALVFCQRCRHDTFVLDIVATINDHVKAMEQPPSNARLSVNGQYLDFATQGLGEHISFFRALAKTPEPEGPEWNYGANFYIGVVLQSVPFWAPLILLYESKSIRELAAATLDELIFTEFNPTSVEANVLDNKLMEKRTVTVVKLAHACFRLMEHASMRRFSKSVVEALFRTCKNCDYWLQKIKLEHEGQVSYNKEREHNMILDDFLQIESRWREWTESDMEELGSATEYLSNEDSDEVLTDA